MKNETTTTAVAMVTIEDGISTGSGYAPIIGGVTGAAIVLGGGVAVFVKRRKGRNVDSARATVAAAPALLLSDDLTGLFERAEAKPPGDTVVTSLSAAGLFNRLDDTINAPSTLPTRAPHPLTSDAGAGEIAELAEMFRSGSGALAHDLDDTRHLDDQTEALAELFSQN